MSRSRRKTVVRTLLVLSWLSLTMATQFSEPGRAADLSPAQKQLAKILAKRHYWEQRLKSEQHQEWVLQQQLTTTHDNLKSQRNKLRAEQARAAAQQSRLQLAINGLTTQIELIRSQLDATRASYRRVHAQAQRLLVRLRQLRARIRREAGNVRQAVVEMYQLSQVSPLETVLEAKSLTDFMSQQSLVNQIGSHDAGVLAWARHEHELVRKAAAGYIARMRALKALQGQEKAQLQLVVVETQRENLLLIRARQQTTRRQGNIKQTEESIRALAAQEQTQLQSVNTSAQDSRKAVEQNQQAAERVAWIISQETGVYPSIGGPTGSLIWPVVGSITQGFGPSPYAFEPAVTFRGVSYSHFHTGLDIAAPFETPVRAAAAGRVIFAGLFVPGQVHASYGLCVIIMHNNTLSTLYAHLDAGLGLNVRVGDIVSQGQIIGFEGVTGNTTGPHLHFEVRANGVWANPLFYLPTQPGE